MSLEACRLTGFKIPQCLDTLAVAYAAASRFDKAIEYTEKAIALLDPQENEKEVGLIRTRLELYQSKRPFTSDE